MVTVRAGTDTAEEGALLGVGPAPRGAGELSRARLMLWVLTAIYVLNFLDRSLLGILAKPIQDELHITDGQLGRIGGLYFAFFYCFIAIPVGWLADRSNRISILALACAIWSGATMACGLAMSYGQLVAARMTVGFGEAGGVPPSYAVITDSFPPGRRGFAFGIYNLGPPIGAALGTAFGASIAAAFNWRDAFLAIGAIGLVAALAARIVLGSRRAAPSTPRASRSASKDRAFGRPRGCSSRARSWCSQRSGLARPSSSPTASAISPPCS